MDPDNLLIIGTSETHADLYYATRFLAPDPVIFIRVRGKDHLLVHDLEIDRAREQARVDIVLAISKLARELRRRTGMSPTLTDVLIRFLRKRRVKALQVPGDFPVRFYAPLKRAGFQIRYALSPCFTERAIKDGKEIRAIRQALHATARAAAKALRVLRRSSIRGNKLYFRGKALTSESLKKIIRHSLLEDGCTGEHTIVSCGPQTVDPHHCGHGFLRPHRPIVMDIFPRHDTTRYYADFTRTVVRGTASPKLRKIYAAVREAQDIACRTIRDGVDGQKVHQAVTKYFESLGYRTGKIRGRMQGFFHSTGHGLGLEVHESPRLGRGRDVLKAGQVVTVEPGLYYKGAGGVRLEDLVVVTKNGCVNLTKFPKTLEI